MIRHFSCPEKGMAAHFSDESATMIFGHVQISWKTLQLHCLASTVVSSDFRARSSAKLPYS